MKKETVHKIIRKMYEDGKRQSEIAKVIGVSRQRIDQIEKSLKLPPRGQYKVERVEFTCIECKKKCLRRPIEHRKYCSNKCRVTNERIYKDYKNLPRSEYDVIANRIRTRLYYHRILKKTPGFYEMIKRRNKRATERRKLIKTQ